MSGDGSLARNNFALGFLSGSLFSLFLLLFLDFFQLLPFADSTFTGAILGAVLAGGIGISGQFLVLSQNERRLNREEKRAERVKIDSLLSRINRLKSTMYQVQQHVESRRDFDNIVFDNLQPLMKPFKINDLPERLAEGDLTLSLQLEDYRLFNLVNALDSIVANFRWTQESYEKAVEGFLEGMQKSGDLKFSEGQFSGVGEINLPEYHALTDLQSHHIESVYSGLVASKEVFDILLEHLHRRHGVKILFSDPISDEQWVDLKDSVDMGDIVSG
ncbi:hypothetical protein Jann_1092 [Jannaschia sp. CCS1]|nr:hypothetical protein Jann_1092 [Jannaschia sp. CCS1]